MTGTDLVFMVMVFFGGPENLDPYFHVAFPPLEMSGYEMCLGEVQMLAPRAEFYFRDIGLEEEWRLDCLPGEELDDYPVLTFEDKPFS